jgi:hypothetical protein
VKIWQLLCASLLVINIAGCGNKAADIATPEVSTSSTAKESTSPSSGDKVSTEKPSGFAAMQAVIKSTGKAIETAKLDAAKTEFDKFEDSWKTVEDGVKSKSPDAYKAIENGVQSIQSGIARKQGKDALLANLQKLSQAIDRASSSN